MSHIYSIVVFGYAEAHQQQIQWLNEALGFELAQVDRHSSGPKAFELEVWLGAANYLDDSAFAKASLRALRATKDDFQILIAGPSDELPAPIDEAWCVRRIELPDRPYLALCPACFQACAFVEPPGELTIGGIFVDGCDFCDTQPTHSFRMPLTSHLARHREQT